MYGESSQVPGGSKMKEVKLPPGTCYRAAGEPWDQDLILVDTNCCCRKLISFCLGRPRHGLEIFGELGPFDFFPGVLVDTFNACERMPITMLPQQSYDFRDSELAAILEIFGVIVALVSVAMLPVRCGEMLGCCDR